MLKKYLMIFLVSMVPLIELILSQQNRILAGMEFSKDELVNCTK